MKGSIGIGKGVAILLRNASTPQSTNMVRIADMDRQTMQGKNDNCTTYGDDKAFGVQQNRQKAKLTLS